jgi:hypothetical protein
MIFTNSSIPISQNIEIEYHEINSEKYKDSILSLQRELEKAASLNSKEIEILGKKVNIFVKYFRDALNEELLNKEIGEEALYISYLMAKTVKPATTMNKKLWQHLSLEAQKFFNELTPYILPPLDNNNLKLFLCSTSTIENMEETLPICFGDQSLFKARYDQTGNGFLFFQLPDFPEIVLCGTSQSPETEHFKEYISKMPNEIQQVFDVEGVNQLISNAGSPNIKNVIFPQYLHQKCLLKMEYLNTLLDVLGVPIDRSIAMAKRGEWVITENQPIKSLYEIRFSSLLEKTACAKGIRKYIELEMKYGIIFAGNNSTFKEGVMSSLEKKNLFVKKGSLVFSHIPKFRLEFIDEPLLCRHKKIEQILKSIYPECFVSMIFDTPIVDEWQGEEIASFLSSCVRNKWVTISSLLHLEESILEIVQILYKHSDLLAYLKTLSKSKNELVATSTHEIISLASLITYSLPTKGKALSTTFEKFTDNLIERQKDLKFLIFKYLISEFKEKTKSLYNIVFQSAVDRLIDQAKPLIDEKTTEFFSLFLKNFLEELGEILTSKVEENSLFYQITILRAAHLVGNQAQKESINDVLHHCLHLQMMAREKKLLIDKLKNKVISILRA